MSKADTESTTAVFDEHRSLLFGIAYRMLGSVMDAEDAVQDAYLRWQKSDRAEVQSPKAYLSAVVTRLCIDVLRSARKQREVYVGEWLPEPMLTTGRDAIETAELAESLSTAFMVMLESLAPPERAAFLLKEVFDYSYSEIAEVVGKNEANCRQMVKRARDRVSARAHRFEPDPAEHERLVGEFVRAAENGDVEGLVSVLAEDAVFYSDHGGKVLAARRPIYGSDKIARFVQGITERFIPAGMETRVQSVNGRPGVINYVDGKPYSVFTIDIRDGRIQNVYSVINPDKLRAIAEQSREG